MKSKSSNRHAVNRAQYQKFFVMLRQAATNLGLFAPEEIDEYRHRVMREEVGVDSIKEMDGKRDFDACIKRFAADVGLYHEAIDIGLQEIRRMAYVIKVMAIQIMQLKGGREDDSRDYLSGIINQSRTPCGVNTSDNSFWMDVSPKSLRTVLQILDTYRRKLIKEHFPKAPTRFDATVRFEIDGNIHTRYTGIPADYYSNIPFNVNVR